MQSPQLDDIGNPGTVGFSLEGPGWYVLLGVIVVVLLIGFWAYLRHRRKNKYRREALKYLEKISDEPTAILLANELMKRICLTFSSRENASLTGKAWIDFLNGQCKSQLFNPSDAEKISAIYYSETPKPDSDFLNKTTHWVRKHGF